MESKEEKESKIVEELTVEKLLDLKDFPYSDIFKGACYPWEVLPHLSEYIRKIVE